MKNSSFIWTFNLPDFQDRVIQGSGTRGNVGTYKTESLPNITGFAVGSTNQVGQFQQNARNGCVETYNKGPGYITSQFTTSIVAADSFQVNASWSSSTYQDNAPVQPNALLIQCCIKY